MAKGWPGSGFVQRYGAFFASLVLLVALAAAVAPAATGSPGGGEVTRFIVATDPDEPPEERQLRARGAADVEELRYTPDTIVVVASERAARAIAGIDGVVHVERDRVLRIQHHRDDHCGGPAHRQPDHCHEDEDEDGDDPATGTIAGIVGDASTGNALGGATVEVRDGGSTTTDADDGAYTITDVPVGTHEVTASADGYENGTAEVTVAEEQTSTVDFSLEPVEPADSTQVIPWGVAKIEAPAAWRTASGESVRVCVADTGIDKGHEDLAYVEGRNFSTNNPHGRNVDPDAYDDRHGHGSHVAGTVAALDNELGVVGVAPDVELLVAKVLRDNGSGYTSQIVDGLHWCAQQGAEVVNMSFGGGGSSTLETAITDLSDKGVVLVAASGNSGGSQPIYPARYDGVVAVGATDEHDAIASFSNRGEDVNAPGLAVLSTVPGGGYEAWSGTSMASPHAAGVAALVIQDGTTDTSSVTERLIDTADVIDDGLRINAAAAVEAPE